MPVIQELRVIFLNMGAILQDIVKETYELYTHYIHVYYVPAWSMWFLLKIMLINIYYFNYEFKIRSKCDD